MKGTIDDNRKDAIYGRKSKYTGKGESINNQKEICLNALRLKNPDLDENEVLFFCDEGYSGFSMDRPDVQRLIKMIMNNEIRSVTFYRLDRLSRSVSDFSDFVNLLDQYNVTFSSATENIENVTPMGKAMMYIVSVFAELERDTIALRIRDNMLELAKTGRWLGGNTPTGYKSEEVKYIDSEGKVRKLFKLIQIAEEVKIIQLIFSKFLELKSLTKLETYLLQNDIKTKNGKTYSRWGLKNILTNPVYAIADEDIYEYFKSLNCEMFADKDKFDGNYGLMVYNKTEHKKNKGFKHKKIIKRDVTEWIIAIGKHKGLIPGSNWVNVQDMLAVNESKRYRKDSQSESLLSGIIRCEYCGSYMRPKLKGKSLDDLGRRRFDYLCELKDKSRKTKCNCKNINGLEADDLVMKTIYNLSSPGSDFYNMIKKISNGKFESSDKLELELTSLEKRIVTNNKKIESYIDKISDISKELIPDFERKILDLKNQNNNIRKQIATINQNTENNSIKVDSANMILDLLNYFNEHFDNLDLKLKRTLLKIIVSSVTTDGNNLTINLVGDRQIDANSIPMGDNCKRDTHVF